MNDVGTSKVQVLHSLNALAGRLAPVGGTEIKNHLFALTDVIKLNRRMWCKKASQNM